MGLRAAKPRCSPRIMEQFSAGRFMVKNTERMEVAMGHTLVPSDRVEGAPVCGRDGAKLGVIERLMLDKTTGTVAYAVVRNRGFLGTDQHHYPVSWSALKYNPARRAYETDLTLDELRSGPCELDGEAFDWGDRSRPYQHPHYWSV